MIKKAIHPVVAVFAVACLLLTGCTSVGESDPRVNSRRSQSIPSEDVSRGDSSGRVHLEVANTFSEAGDYKSAVENYRKAIELDDALYDAQLGLAKSLYSLDDKDGAIAVLNKLLRALSSAPEGYYLDSIRSEAEGLQLEIDEVGVALRDAADLLAASGAEAEQSGRDKNAYEIYGRALDLWPGHQAARKSLVSLCRKNGWALPNQFIEPLFAYSAQDVHFKLSDLVPTVANVPNDELRVDQTKWGLPFYNQGQVFDRGVWAPAPSLVEFDLDARYKKFVVQLMVSAFKGQKEQIEALEKELLKPGTGTVRFRVKGDGEVLFESGVVTYDMGPQVVEIDVSGVSKLDLEVTDADGRDLLDFAVWAEGKLYM